MKKIIISVLTMASLVTFSGCTDGFDDTNTTSTALTEDQVSAAMLFVREVDNGVNANYQRNHNLYDDQYAFYFSNVVSSFKTGNYEYNSGWDQCGWSEFYTERLKEYNDIADICSKNGDSYTDMKAMNEIWNCFLWQRVTDRWGDVPYTGAGEGTTVAYNSQQDIYLDLLNRLKTACSKIGSSSVSQYSPGTSDLLYSGDATEWKKFGYSLMLRMAMRISNVNASDAKTYAQIALSGGTFTSNNDVAKVVLDLVNGGYDYLNNVVVSWANSCTCKDFLDYMRGSTTGYARADTLDPRASRWFVPGIYGYVGFRNGLAASNYPSDYSFTNYACINIADSGYFYYTADNSTSRMYFPVMNYSEVLFLKAEAALRGWGGDAEALYEAAITASMNDVSNISTNTISQAEIDKYIAGLPSFSSASTKEAKLKLIMVQKWIALFPNSVEAWAEMRRTGYPDNLTYPDVSSSAVVTDGDWIQRISYPNNEYEQNESNMPTNYQSSGSFYSKREQYGVWWSLCGQDKTLAKDYTPSNTF